MVAGHVVAVRPVVVDGGRARGGGEAGRGAVERGGGTVRVLARGAVPGAVLGALAVVGGAVAVGGRDVLAAVLEAVADVHAGRALSDGHTLEHLVRERAEGVLHALGDGGVHARGGDAVRAPDAAVRVVVHDEELLVGEGGRARRGADLDCLHLHLGLDGGERVVALGRHARGAVRAAVAEVALAALDLLGVPQLVGVALRVVAVVLVRDRVRREDVAGRERLRARGGGEAGRGTEAGGGGAVLVLAKSTGDGVERRRARGGGGAVL